MAEPYTNGADDPDEVDVALNSAQRIKICNAHIGMHYNLIAVTIMLERIRESIKVLFRNDSGASYRWEEHLNAMGHLLHGTRDLLEDADEVIDPEDGIRALRMQGEREELAHYLRCRANGGHAHG